MSGQKNSYSEGPVDEVDHEGRVTADTQDSSTTTLGNACTLHQVVGAKQPSGTQLSLVVECSSDTVKVEVHGSEEHHARNEGQCLGNLEDDMNGLMSGFENLQTQFSLQVDNFICYLRLLNTLI